MRNLLLLDIILDLVFNLVIVYIYINTFSAHILSAAFAPQDWESQRADALHRRLLLRRCLKGLAQCRQRAPGLRAKVAALQRFSDGNVWKKHRPKNPTLVFFPCLIRFDDRLREIFWPFLCFFRAFWRNSMTCKLLHDLFHFGSRIFE